LELRGAQHAFDTFPSIRANAVVEAAAHFLNAIWTAHRDTAATDPTSWEVRDSVAEELGAELTDVID
jgi:hypothetical protein